MMSEEPSWEDWFYYDETSPSCLRWKVSTVSGFGKINTNPGDIAGCLSSEGYWTVGLFYKVLRCHRIIWKLLKGDLPRLIDHIDRNKSNNSISNLRGVTPAENKRNSSLPSNNKTGIMGVFLRNDRGVLTYVAIYHNLEGKQSQRSFSCNKYGKDEAFRLACSHRDLMIHKLNLLGAGYTETHGK